MNKNKFTKEFSKIVKATRTDLGLTQHEFARKINVSQGQLSKIETGQLNTLDLFQYFSFAKASAATPETRQRLISFQNSLTY